MIPQKIQDAIIHNECIVMQKPVLRDIHERAVSKFFDVSNEEIIFYDLVDYIKSQLKWKKQSMYINALALVKSVCDRVGESFWDAVEYACPNPKNYREIYQELIH